MRLRRKYSPASKATIATTPRDTPTPTPIVAPLLRPWLEWEELEVLLAVWEVVEEVVLEDDVEESVEVVEADVVVAETEAGSVEVEMVVA